MQLHYHFHLQLTDALYHEPQHDQTMDYNTMDHVWCHPIIITQ